MKKKLFSTFSTMSTVVLTFSACSLPSDDVAPQERPDAPQVSATPIVRVSPANSIADATPEAVASADEFSQNQYQDGTYALKGKYVSPAGPEALDVTITLKNDTIADVAIVPSLLNPGTNKNQTNFAAGINELVVGKSLESISTFASVNGSSLTPMGFQNAIEQLQAEAAIQ